MWLLLALGIVNSDIPGPINVEFFRQEIIRPSLQQIGLYSKDAEELLLGTAIQESRLRYLVQINGPAKGIYQIEPVTYFDIWERYLSDKPVLAEAIRNISRDKNEIPHPDELIFNLSYSTVMARIFYLRFAEPLPDAGDIEGMARYWKKYYNTHLGSGTVEEWVDGYKRYAID